MRRVGFLILATAAAAWAQVRPGNSASTGVASSPTTVQRAPTNTPRSPLGPVRPVAPGRPNIISPSGTGVTPPNIVAPGLPRQPRTVAPRTVPQGVVPPGLQAEDPQRPPRHRRPSRRGATRVFVPIYYPVFGYDQTPNVIEVGPGNARRSSVGRVVVVGGGARTVSSRTVVQEVEPEITRAPEVEDEPREIETDYILIALAGGLIYAVESYELDFGAITFTTIQGERYVVSRAEVDVEFTQQLNAERGVEIDLE